MRRTRLLLIPAAAVVLMALTGCGGGTPSASPTPIESSSTPSAEPSPSEAPAAPAALPTDCGQVGSAATRAATVDQMTLQGDGEGFVRPAPEGAQLALGCDWIEGDATGYLLLVSTADADAAQAYAESALPGEGYSCTVGDVGAYICTMTTAGSVEPVDTVETIYVRDGVWIYQSATNTDGEALLTDLVGSIWAA
jgi:hypothetical protein